MNTLLIIASRYPHANDSISGSFVKSQVDELKNYFKRVVVISTTPYVPNFVKSRRRDSLAREYQYDNVEVFFTRDLILPYVNSKRNKDMKGLKSALAIMKKHNINPDMIHAHYLWPSGFIAMKLSLKYKIPFVVTGHGYDVYDLPFRNSYYKNKVVQVLHKAKKIITVSQKNKIILLKLSAPEEKITVIPNGFNPGLFFPMDKEEIKCQLKLPLDKKIILSVGSLKPIKGHSYLIKSIIEVIKHRKDILFVIVGDGSEKERLVKFIKANNLSDYCYLKGAISHDDIPYWMNACDLFVLPSLNEGVPTVLFEALGTGKPFVGSNVGGISEIIINSHFGSLVSPKNPELLADAILISLQKAWDSRIIIEHSKKYRWDELARNIQNVYNEVLPCKKVGRDKRCDNDKT